MLRKLKGPLVGAKFVAAYLGVVAATASATAFIVVHLK